MKENKELTSRQEFILVMIGVSIGIFYTGVFMLVTNFDWEEIEIIPEADAQILPFEQQLEQIRAPDECTRKVVQGKSAEVPFTLKVFYDVTRDNKLEFKQQGTSFPVVQRTNQVMTFFTEGTDQYEIFMELNYVEAKPRQIYIEYLSGNQIVQSTQEKFEGLRFCMTIFVNTIKVEPLPTKEDIFGESLTYIEQIPAMVTAFNANSRTEATAISYQWILLFAVVILSILTLINTYNRGRRFDSRMKDFEDSIVEVNKMTEAMDNLVRDIVEPLEEIKKDLRAILNLPEIKEKLPEIKKESTFKNIKKFISKKKKPEEKELMSEEEVIALAEEKPKTESDEVLEALQVKPDEHDEPKEKPSGGFVIEESIEESEPTKEKVSPTPLPKENNPMRLQPKIFKEIMKEIDYKTNQLKEGAIDKFSYTELNESFAWIAQYRKWIEDENIDVPEIKKTKQMIAERIIYYAIMKKIKERSEV